MVTVDTISYATGESALGRVLVARSISGVCAILIGAHDNELVTDLAARFPEAKLVPDEADVELTWPSHSLRGQADEGPICRLTCAGRRFSAAFGKPCARFQSEPR